MTTETHEASVHAPREQEWRIDGWWYRELIWTDEEWSAIPPGDRPTRAVPWPHLGIVTLLVLDRRADPVT